VLGMDGQRSDATYVAAMRGKDTKQSSMVCLMSPESAVPKGHPLRRIKRIADEALAELSSVFDAMYSGIGRPSIPPERLLKGTLLMAFYTVRSERMLCEQLEYNLLFRWFLDMDMTEPAIDHTTFSRNRERLLSHDVAARFFSIVVEQARCAKLMSSEHFTVDGTLIEAWASLKSFRAKDKQDRRDPPDDPGNPSVDFKGEKRSNATHASTTDPDARLMRKGFGKEAKLSYSGHALMENRNGLLVDLRIDTADGTAERRVALAMIDGLAPGRTVTLGADKGYDTREFIAQCRARNVVPHVAQYHAPHRSSAIDARTTRHTGYVVSQRRRKLVEEIFGWMKSVGGLRRTRFRGLLRTRLAAYFVAAAYNLLRIAKLLPLPEPA
jgi:transposase